MIALHACNCAEYVKKDLAMNVVFVSKMNMIFTVMFVFNNFSGNSLDANG